MDIEQGQVLSKLSVAQIDTLRLVYAHKNSKEIARIMDVSSHTVDERIRVAMRKLGVDSRTKAALIVANEIAPTAYQPLMYQPSVIGADDEQLHLLGPQQEADGPDPFWMRLPFPTRRRPYNTDTIGMRLLWPLVIAISTIMAFAALYTVLLGLGAMLS